MFLSRLVLSPHSRQAARELAEPYEMHRTILHAFGEILTDDERVLFRVEDAPQLDAPLILVQSLNKPDWSFLNREQSRSYLHRLVNPNPAVKSYDPSIHPQQVLRFRLRANPTVKQRTDDGRAVRRGIVNEGAQREWLARKAADSGFRIMAVEVWPEGKERGQIHRASETHDLTLLAVRFDGLLMVTDVTRFQGVLRNGIGSAKGLGFGLLSVAPPA